MMMSLFVILLFPWIPAALAMQSCSSPYTQTYFKLQGHVMKSSSESTRKQCYDQCVLQNGCHSINFYKTKTICELNNANHLSNPESLDFSADSEYVNYGERPPAKCSNKLCNEPLECVIDGQDYKCKASCKDYEYEVNFPSASTSNYVLINNAFVQSFTAFTLSFWLKVPASYTKTAMIFSYKTSAAATSMSLEIKNGGGAEIMINGGIKTLKTNLVKDSWQHVIITWTGSTGDIALYRNGVHQESTSGMQKGQTVISGGNMYLGQKHGGFDATKVMQGSIADLHIWANAVGSSIALIMSTWACKTTSRYSKGDVLAWEAVLAAPFNGLVTKTCPTTCK